MLGLAAVKVAQLRTHIQLLDWSRPTNSYWIQQQDYGLHTDTCRCYRQSRHQEHNLLPSARLRDTQAERHTQAESPIAKRTQGNEIASFPFDTPNSFTPRLVYVVKQCCPAGVVAARRLLKVPASNEICLVALPCCVVKGPVTPHAPSPDAGHQAETVGVSFS